VHRAAAFVCVAGSGLIAQDPATPVQTIRILGADADDARLIHAALGLREGRAADAAAVKQALAAARRLGRFQSVEGQWEGGVFTLTVVPLKPVARVTWMDGLPPKAAKALLSPLPLGARFGDLRLQEWQSDAKLRLRDGGWPEAEPSLQRLEDGALLQVTLHLGPSALVRTVTVEGELGPYSAKKLQSIAGLAPGKTLWSGLLARKAPQQLRERFLKDKRLEGKAEVVWDPAQGRVSLQVQVGPKVQLKLKGASVGGFLSTERSLSELLPESRAAVYDPRLVEEGARRLRRHFKDQGYTEVTVSAERQVLEGPAEHPRKVVVLHTAVLGTRYALGDLVFEGSSGVEKKELRSATATSLRRLLGKAWVGPELQRIIEDRVRNLYRLKGYPDVRVHTEVEPPRGDRRDVKVVVREGTRRLLKSLDLELSPNSGLDPMRFREALIFWLQDHPTPHRRKDGSHDYPADRAHLEGLAGVLETLPPTPEGGARFRIVSTLPVPYVRSDLAQVVSALRQQLMAAGSENPQVRFEDDGKSDQLLIQIPAQPLDHFRRLVVRNIDRTRPEALLREYPRQEGDPFNPVELDQSLGRASDLGAFSRLDLSPLSEQPDQKEMGWMRGDLDLKTQERSPWTYTSGFAYDNAQGYRFLEGVQRNNLGGMGRTVDFSIRAGDSTLRSKALKDLFPTGNLNRSLDSYTLAYTDPWFLPGSLDHLLSPRTQFRIEGAYLEEAQPAFFARRRRVLSGLEWKITERQTAQLGYRYERADLGANRDASGNELISPEDLKEFARTTLHSVVSAPRLQVNVDSRDKPNDPTQGAAFEGLLEFGLQSFGTSSNASFIRLDLRNQWNWPVGFQASAGVFSVNLRVGIARPTANSVQELPLTERYFGGGPFSVRGVEPGFLGPTTYLGKRDPATGQLISGAVQLTPLGGQAIATANLEYRFPLPVFGQSFWGEIFVDGGQVYERIKAGDRLRLQRDPLNPSGPSVVVDTGAPFPAWRVTPGFGVILKLGFPIKLEYAADWRRILGRPRTKQEQETQLSTLLISAGFQY
jgi:outer membrane protein assembly factor BamA